MKKAVIAVCCAMLVAPVFAKSCDELKSEIDAKIQAHGAKNYTLTIMANADVKDQKVVGSCEGGSKKIVYKRE